MVARANKLQDGIQEDTTQNSGTGVGRVSSSNERMIDMEGTRTVKVNRS